MVTNFSEERIPSFFFIPDDGSDMFVRNVGNCLRGYTASQSMIYIKDDVVLGFGAV
jgi:hypothetical protein